MKSFLSAECVAWLAMPGMDVRGAGVKLFFSDFDDEDHDIRLRVEPLAAEPHAKAFVNVIGRFRKAKEPEIAGHIEQLRNVADAAKAGMQQKA